MILVVVDKQRAIAADPVKKVTVKGRVTDETKSPLPGVTVVVKIPGATANTIGTSTDVNGKYELSWVDQKNVSLVFSFVGMETQEVAYTNQKEIDVVMKEETKALEDVVITGYFQRKKVSQTGSEVVVEGEELRKVGSLNLLQAISAFDPGVRTLEIMSSVVTRTVCQKLQCAVRKDSIYVVKRTIPGRIPMPRFILWTESRCRPKQCMIWI